MRTMIHLSAVFALTAILLSCKQRDSTPLPSGNNPSSDFFALPAAPSGAGAPRLSGQAAPNDPRIAKMDAYVRAYADAGTFMGTVLVAKGKEVLFCKGYGLANLAEKIPNDERTQYRLGSITKGFTATAILKLQEKGRLSIDDPISKYVADFPEGDRITIRQLLAHTSGLPDYLNLPDAFAQMANPIALDDLIALFSGEKLEFQPGQKFSYSNSGYLLCTKIIEKVSGQSYADYLQSAIFDPVGMDNSGYYYEAAVGKERRAIGYHFTGEGYVPAPLWDTSRAAGAGAIFSTAGDLLAWSRALAGGKLLGKASIAEMFGPTVQSNKSYGLGWYLRPNLGRKRVFHGGYLFGFRSDLSRYPDDEVDIIVLSNVDQANTRKISEDLAAILFGAPRELPAARVPAKADPALYAKLAGLYDTSEVFGEGATERVQAEGDRLWYQANTIYDSLGLPMYIYPSSDGSFFDKTGEARYTFILGKGGTAEAMEAGDSNESYRFPLLRP